MRRCGLRRERAAVPSRLKGPGLSAASRALKLIEASPCLWVGCSSFGETESEAEGRDAWVWVPERGLQCLLGLGPELSTASLTLSPLPVPALG